MDREEQTRAFPQNESLKDFGPIIGTWDTVGTHGMIPNTTLHGRTTFSWHESGAFIIQKTHIQEDVGIPDGVAIIGSDGQLGAYVMIYYDERGVSRHYEMSVERNVIKWWRDDPQLSQRTTLTIADNGRVMIARGEMSKDGSTWEQDLDLTYSKV